MTFVKDYTRVSPHTNTIHMESYYTHKRAHGGASVVRLIVSWTTDHYHLSSNLGVGISEGCVIFDLASLPLEVARPI